MSEDDQKPIDPDEIKRQLQDFFKDKFPGTVRTIITSVDSEEDEEAPPKIEAEAPKKSGVSDALKFSLTPAEVKTHLDRYVIGQDEAKRTLAVAVCDHYNHVRGVHELKGKAEALDYIKQNVILIGPTGVGKTYLIRTIAQLIGVPFVKADITKFSETGYVGGDVDDLVRELVRTADGDVELAEYGIIFLDEIDKIASATNLMGRDVSGRGVQTGLLKLLEETEVPVRSPSDITAQFQELMQMRRGKTGKRMINTRHILFVVSGAFTGLGDIVEKRLSERSVGFRSATDASLAARENIYSQVNTRDFVEYGFEPEFIGRLPIRVALRDLSEDDLFRILTTSEGSIVKQHCENFRGYGIEASFEDEALRAVAARAIQEKTGARGLMTVLESSLRTFKFHLPGTNVKHLLIRRDTIESPEAVLDRVRSNPEKAGVEQQVHEYVQDLARRENIRLELDDAAQIMAAAVAKELHLEIPEYLETVFSGHSDFLRRMLAETGRRFLPITPRVLNRPEDGAQIWTKP